MYKISFFLIGMMLCLRESLNAMFVILKKRPGDDDVLYQPVQP